MSEKILVVAPHCDDEILGCGGTMAKKIDQGHSVYVAVVTNGNLGAPELFSEEDNKKVRTEALKAHKFLGVTDTFFLDFPAPKLDSIASYKLSGKINNLLHDLEIDTLYIPHRGDIHKDHRITYESCLVAARPVNNNQVKEILAYETVSETEWAPPFGDDAFIPTVFEDIEHYIEKKLEAFKIFHSQIKEPPHPRSLENLEDLSKLRGSIVGYKNCEAFMLVRWIR